jgi:5-methylcytosine-specific restriction endonuclease McrA
MTAAARRDLAGNLRRVRGRRLMRIREDWLSEHPLCVMCQLKDPPLVTAATILDHRVALVNGGPDFDEPGGDQNKQGLCDDCNEVKTAQDLGYTPKPRRLIGPDGFPIDPT